MHPVRLHLPWETNQFPSLFRQTPNSNGAKKDIQFCINEGPEPCDFLVVFAGQKGIIQEPILASGLEKTPFYRLKFRFGRFLRPNLKT